MVEYSYFQDVVQNLEILYGDEDLSDFIVKVEDIEIPCNKFVLAASSPFFRGLFRSGMKEATDGLVTIPDVSARYLLLIIKSLYTGKIMLTYESFVDIWRTADLLQIEFVKKACELFAIRSLTLENLHDIMHNTKQFSLFELKIAIRNFMLENFDAIAEINGFIEIQFPEFLFLIESRNLKSSSEDLVLEVVIKWIEHVPKHYCFIGKENLPFEINSDIQIRRNALLKLLKALRLALVSLPVLRELQKHDLVKTDKTLESTVSESIMDKVTNAYHGQWRTNGIHRAYSEYDHYGMTYDASKDFIFISAFDESFYTCARNGKLVQNVTLVTFGPHIFASGCKHALQRNSTLWMLNGHVWRRVTDLPGRELILVPYDDALYIFNKNTSYVARLYPTAEKIRAHEFAELPGTIKLVQVVAYLKGFLLFSSLQEHGGNSTRVHYFNVLTKYVQELEPLLGPCEEIISFSNDENTFVLQKNGNVFIVLKVAKKIYITLIGKLWDIDRQLCGAITYKQKLIVYGSDPRSESPQQILKVKLAGHFNKIRYIGNDNHCSNFIAVTAPKNVVLALKQ